MDGEWAVPWANRRSWSLGNCPTVVVTSPAGASEDLSGESATQVGGGCPWAGASTAEGSLRCWRVEASASGWEMSWSKAAATAGLMSRLDWVSDPACCAARAGGGPSGEGGRCWLGAGAWFSPGAFTFDASPSEKDRTKYCQNIIYTAFEHDYNPLISTFVKTFKFNILISTIRGRQNSTYTNQASTQDQLWSLSPFGPKWTATDQWTLHFTHTCGIYWYIHILGC